jgi:hypothetical protein
MPSKCVFWGLEGFYALEIFFFEISRASMPSKVLLAQALAEIF